MSGTSLRAPGSINDARAAAHLAIGQRLEAIDLTPLLIYTITGAPASALPFLTWQFDISSPFWELLGAGETQTALVQNAIQMHRYHGTVYAIQTIMKTIGFPSVTIQEGQASWGGSQYPSNQGWAVFRVLAPAGGAAVNATTQMLAVAAIEFFKPARSVLDSLWFQQPAIAEPAIGVSDWFTALGQDAPITITDTWTAPFAPVREAWGITPYYNALYDHAGITYGANEPAIADGPITQGGNPIE